jgi:hypothetical protein
VSGFSYTKSVVTAEKVEAGNCLREAAKKFLEAGGRKTSDGNISEVIYRALRAKQWTLVKAQGYVITPEVRRIASTYCQMQLNSSGPLAQEGEQIAQKKVYTPRYCLEAIRGVTEWLEDEAKHEPARAALRIEAAKKKRHERYVEKQAKKKQEEEEKKALEAANLN